MKASTLIPIAAIIALTMCTRSIENDPEHEITFQVASYSSLNTKGNTDYKTNYAAVPFGAYAWYKGVNASDNTDFMTNQQVTYVATDNVWKPAGTTYYWPKTGTLDFFCYSPYTADGSAAPAPTVTETSLAYPSWNVNSNLGVDVMYSDKALNLQNNTTTYYYNGVPVLFHHALARLGFACRLAYDEITAPTGDKTKWEVIVNSITLKDVKTTGTLALGINADGEHWDKPASNVWTNDGTKTDIALDVTALTTFTDVTPQTIGTPFFVIPQALNEGQKVVINLTIKTYRDTGAGYALVLTETGVDINGTLSSGALASWGINQNITYTFILAPSSPVGTGVDLDGDGIEDQEPIVIHFDPAVDDWEDITVSAGINL